MNAQSRMAKTLGCLVGAMTVGAIVLHWIEPAGPPSDNGYAVQLVALEVKRAVQPDTEAKPARWQGVIVRADGNRVAGFGGPHFRVTNGGELIACPAWQRQQDSVETGFIEVSLDTPRQRGAGLSPRQANTLIALLSELRRGYLTEGGQVQLDEQSFAAERRGRGPAPAQRLKELLHSAGLSS